MNQTRVNVGRKGKKGRPIQDVSFRRHVAQLYNEGEESLKQLRSRLGVSITSIRRWAKEFSPELRVEPTEQVMNEQEQKDMEALRKQVKLLEQKLEYEKMKTFALETMIDLAKTELQIDVRKNFGAKQPKK